MSESWMEFASGGIMVGCLAVGLLFLRFWRSTRDRLFLIFAAAFWMLAIERLLLMGIGVDNEIRPFIYGIRLAAFAGILAAIVDKNRK